MKCNTYLLRRQIRSPQNPLQTSFSLETPFPNLSVFITLQKTLVWFIASYLKYLTAYTLFNFLILGLRLNFLIIVGNLSL